MYRTIIDFKTTSKVSNRLNNVSQSCQQDSGFMNKINMRVHNNILGEQESPWSCHMWAEFNAGSRPCSKGFSPGCPVFLSPEKLTFQIPPGSRKPARTDVASSLNIVIFLVFVYASFWYPQGHCKYTILKFLFTVQSPLLSSHVVPYWSKKNTLKNR